MRGLLSNPESAVGVIGKIHNAIAVVDAERVFVQLQ
jgi:hypothetical protein